MSNSARPAADIMIIMKYIRLLVMIYKLQIYNISNLELNLTLM